MQNPNVPRHDDISVKLDIGVLSDISYALILKFILNSMYLITVFYQKYYPWLWLVLHITYIALS